MQNFSPLVLNSIPTFKKITTFAFEPAIAKEIVIQTSKGFSVLWLDNDDYPENPLETWDGVGRIYTARRHAKIQEHHAMQEALGLDRDWRVDQDGDQSAHPDVVKLDCYKHSGETWSVTQTGQNCRFDRSAGAGVWIPDETLFAILQTLPDSERKEQRIVYARQACELYNSYLNGDVYALKVAYFDINGLEIEADKDTSVDVEVSGLFGYKEAVAYLEQTAQRIRATLVQKSTH